MAVAVAWWKYNKEKRDTIRFSSIKEPGGRAAIERVGWLVGWATNIPLSGLTALSQRRSAIRGHDNDIDRLTLAYNAVD